jgi:hypothetical protein
MSEISYDNYYITDCYKVEQSEAELFNFTLIKIKINSIKEY